MNRKKKYKTGSFNVRIDDSLEQYKSKTGSDEKLERAVKILDRVGLPKELNKK